MRYAAAALVLILAVTGLLFAWRSYTTSIDAAGYARGVAETTATWRARDNAQLQAALAAQHAAEVRARAAEDAQAAALNDARSNYTKGVQDGQAASRTALAGLHTGALRLSDPGATSRPCAPGGIGVTPSALGATGFGYDDQAGAGFLSESASVFLVTEATRADAIVQQLTFCQARVESDLRVCGP